MQYECSVSNSFFQGQYLSDRRHVLFLTLLFKFPVLKAPRPDGTTPANGNGRRKPGSLNPAAEDGQWPMAAKNYAQHAF